MVVGFPFDATSTFRLGSRKGPDAIREASLNIETFSFRTGLYMEDLKICDLGNIEPVEELKEMLTRLNIVLSKIFTEGKMPVVLGGEHTLSYAAAQALPPRVSMISFDAHLDLRDIYENRSLSHTTFLRRITEKLGSNRIHLAGVRAVGREELKFAEAEQIRFLTSQQIRQQPRRALKMLRSFTQNFAGVYLSIDIDVLDPAYAPAVGNPEPEGLDTTLLLEILQDISCASNVVGLDLVEVAPDYDSGCTAIQAAKILFETLCTVQAIRMKR